MSRDFSVSVSEQQMYMKIKLASLIYMCVCVKHSFINWFWNGICSLKEKVESVNPNRLCFSLNAYIYQMMQCFGLGFKCETQASKSWQGWFSTRFTIFFALFLLLSFFYSLRCSHLLSGICYCVTGAWTGRWRCGSDYQESLIYYNQKETQMKFCKSRSECLHALS